MHTHFAQRISQSKRSFTRTILDLSAQKKILSFAGGLPDPSLFPKETIESCAQKLFQTSTPTLFQYSGASGIEPLKEAIAQTYLTSSSQEIMLTNGSQQGLDLICKTFLEKGTSIVVEDPSYLAALSLFRLYEANIHGVTLHSEGVDTTLLEYLFKTHSPTFFYAIPTFQNPTGYTYSLETKKEVARLARKYNVIVIEDNPYEALRYEGEACPSFSELLPELTLCLGTFSKTLAPDFRIGWIKAPQKVIYALTCTKESSDLQNSKFFQHICAMMMEDGSLKRHTQTLIEAYKGKRDTMCQALKSYFGEDALYTIPQGGMFLWINFRGCLDSMVLFEHAIKEGVAFVPGSVFFADDRTSSFGRLNYTHASKEDIIKGVASLHKAYEITV